MPPSSSKSTAVPKNWPPQLPYLTTQAYSPTLTSTHLTALRARPNDAQAIPSNTPRGPCFVVKITPIPSGSTHPAAGQCGLFATRDLKPGTFILQYIGEVHASSPASASTSTSTAPQDTVKEDPHAESNYDLSLDRFHGLGIDADKKGNEARFINDYRGVPGREGQKANAEFREVWDEGRGERGMGVWVLGSGKEKGGGSGGGKSGQGKNAPGKGKGSVGIKKGEEILVSYGRGFWGARREEEEWEGEDTWTKAP